MKIAALAAVFAGLALATNAYAAAPEPTKPVDPAKFFHGRWYEIGRKPMKLTDGCVAGWTEYTQTDKPNRIKVLDGCHDKTPGGKLKTLGGPTDILDMTTHAKLSVHYQFAGFIPITRGYWILDHDEDYTWFIESDPTFDMLWIYTRAANPDPSLIEDLKKKAQGFGYDTSKLEFPTQEGK